MLNDYMLINDISENIPCGKNCKSIVDTVEESIECGHIIVRKESCCLTDEEKIKQLQEINKVMKNELNKNK